MKHIFSCIIAALIATCSTGSATAQTAIADTIHTIEIKVANLHCNNDMPTIKKRLLDQEGIDEVRFTSIKGECSVFTVIYHSSATTQQKIERAIEATPGCDDNTGTPYKVKHKKAKS